MMEKLKVGDRVRIGDGIRLWRVSEVDPPGIGTPRAPSTYIVMIEPEDGVGPPLRYGDHPLKRLD